MYNRLYNMYRFLSFAKRKLVKGPHLTNPITGKIINKPLTVKNDTMQLIVDNYYNKRFTDEKFSRVKLKDEMINMRIKHL